MICSSVNLFFTSNPPARGLDSKPFCYSKSGGRRAHRSTQTYRASCPRRKEPRSSTGSEGCAAESLSPHGLSSYPGIHMQSPRRLVRASPPIRLRWRDLAQSCQAPRRVAPSRVYERPLKENSDGERERRLMAGGRLMVLQATERYSVSSHKRTAPRRQRNYLWSSFIAGFGRKVIPTSLTICICLASYFDASRGSVSP
jgi:hypothetical protein